MVSIMGFKFELSQIQNTHYAPVFLSSSCMAMVLAKGFLRGFRAAKHFLTVQWTGNQSKISRALKQLFYANFYLNLLFPVSVCVLATLNI